MQVKGEIKGILELGHHISQLVMQEHCIGPSDTVYPL